MNNERHHLIKDKRVFISCVVPVYNEAAHIALFISALNEQLQTLTQHYEIIVVDDGSVDGTVSYLPVSTPQCPLKLIGFSRNFGKEAALTAGLAHCQGDVVVLIDADFQHPVELLPTFLQYWAQGYDIVYGVQQSRRAQSLIKRTASKAFYRLMCKIAKIRIPAHAGDFRLLDKQAVHALNQLDERERFMKGLYAWIGFSHIGIPFTVQTRASGTSSWSFWHLIELALVGITSFSNVPLRVWSLFGFVISLIAFIYGSIIVVDTWLHGTDLPGFATIVVAIMFFGGVQLLSIGILGEYIARIFNEVKHRPNYIVAKKTGFDE